MSRIAVTALIALMCGNVTTPAKAEEDQLLGWNSFRFGMSRQEVQALSHDQAVPMSNGTQSLSNVDFNNLKVIVGFSYTFDEQAQHDANKLLSIVISGNAPQTCADYAHNLSDPLEAKYGPFKIVEEDGKPNTDLIHGPIINDPHLLKNITLTKQFRNNTFIYAKMVSTNSGHTCKLTLMYSVRPPPAPPQPAKLGPQGF